MNLYLSRYQRIRYSVANWLYKQARRLRWWSMGL